MKTFVHEQNIKNYRKRLEQEPINTASDDCERKTVLDLLSEEEKKDNKISPAE